MLESTKVIWVSGVERRVVSHSRRSDEQIHYATSRFASGLNDSGRQTPVVKCYLVVDRQGVEVLLNKTQTTKSFSANISRTRHQYAEMEFSN